MADNDGRLSYKELHEAFVANHNGTTILENFIIVSSGPFFVFFVCCLYQALAISKLSHGRLQMIAVFFIDLLFMIFPLVLNFTLFTDISYEFFATVVCLFLTVMLYLVLFKKNSVQKDFLSAAVKNKPFITYFRSIVNIITAICILAVDFKVFPRRLAKTENFGYGLMDTGVGFYIVTNGLVVDSNKTYSNKSDKLNFVLKSCLNVVPLLILGGVRFFTVTAIDYQTHFSEYGVHWNFFFTLAFVKLFSSFLLLFFSKYLVMLTLSTLLCHQFLLSVVDFQGFILNSSVRNNLITANKEGLVSLPGYLALYFASLYLGQVLKNVQTFQHRVTYLVKFIFYLLFMLCLLLASDKYFLNSRRLANITYVIWMLSLSIYIIVLCFIIELSLEYFYNRVSIDKAIFVPRILEAINYNGLTFFLVANLLTGLVNLCFQTLYMTDKSSIFVMTAYSFASVTIVNVLYSYKIRLKWW